MLIVRLSALQLIAVRELCDMRDSDDTQVFGDSELKFMIDMLCTK